MNKPLLNAIAASVVIHAGALPIATHGQLAEMLKPLDELRSYQDKQAAMSFTFVESPASQLKDEEPQQKTNLISDKSTVASDTFKGPSAGPANTPHVEQVGSGKQVGRLMGMPEPPIKVPEQQPIPKIQPLSQAQPAKPRPVMKALKVEDESAPTKDANDEDELRLKKEYMEKIKELQQKIDRATKQMKENEEILRKQKTEQNQQEDDILRREDRNEQKNQQQREQQEERKSSNGRVGFGGASLHSTSSDLQGDVERFGEISFNAKRYEMGEYFRKLKTKVEEYWLPYLAFTYTGNNLFGNKTVVFFKIMPNGKVSGVKILEHSGDQLLKDFCVSSVQNTAPFDPLPESFLKNSGYNYLPIVFTFNY